MKNRRVISIIILISILIAGAYYTISGIKSNNDSSRSKSVENNIESKEVNMEESNGNSKKNKEDNEDKNAATGARQKVEVAIGKEAPNFTLRNLEGREVFLEDYRGKIVLLNFWATWCVFCDIEMPDLQRLDQENEDLVVLAVDVMEDKETVEAYIREGGYDFEVVLDEDRAIARLYLVGGYPTSYFIDEEGILTKSIPGMMTYDQMNKILNEIREK